MVEMTEQMKCPKPEIAAYVDGELGASDELALEMHIAGCGVCAAELNLQKQIFCALDMALDAPDEIEIPEDFAKIVATNAESNVRGLRSPRERWRALAVVVGLLALVVVGLGAESANAFTEIGTIADQVVAVGGFFARSVHDFGVATAVIFRSVFQQVLFRSAFPAIAVGAFFVFSFVFLSRLMHRHGRS